MNVLWITAQILPIVADDLKIKKSGFGGWVMNMLNQLNEVEDIHLAVAMVSKNVSKLKKIEKNGIVCFVAPDKSNKDISEFDRDTIINEFMPDIIHIEGNEFGIHNCFSKIVHIPVLLSLQGILSGYEPYQYGEIPIVDYMFSPKSRNMIFSWILFLRKHILFDKRIETEKETIRNVRYISGRTFWDRAHSYWINPNAIYFPCNRILRPVFYQEKWNLSKIERHTIFVGNGYSPLKGVHNVIDAAMYLKREYSDLKVYIAGDSPIISKGGLSIQKFGYSSFIRRKIKKYNLENTIVFTGSLLGNDMVNRMKTTHVYCLPSLIENSPNTLGEAMMLGMPCVSAYTGGASEMALDEKECLFYRANDPKLLAWQIKRIFDSDDLAISLGSSARKHALVTHNPEKNRDSLIVAYKKILGYL